MCDTVSDTALTLVDLGVRDVTRIKALIEKYRDLPMDFAYAALVCAAEKEGLTRIVTFDRHFELYRLPRPSRFTILPARR